MFRALYEGCKNIINIRFERWLNRRVPNNFQHKLSNRNIFIIPTRFGFSYLFFVVLLFLLGTNYQNNIILLISYLLASLFITVMLHSFYNFSQLTFSSKAKQTGFAKQVIQYPIMVTGHKTHFDINFQFVNTQKKAERVKLEQCGSQSVAVLLPWFAKQRGVYSLGRVKVFSEYSFGLFISWSLLDFSHEAIVYPEPKKLSSNQKHLIGVNNDDKEEGVVTQKTLSGDDFSDLKNFVIGESQARIAWKQLARGQGKFSKDYQSHQGRLPWLKLSNMPSTNIETKLQFLCFLILEYTQNKQKFGLLLDYPLNAGNDCKVEPNIGKVHQDSCLLLLAIVKRFNHK